MPTDVNVQSALSLIQSDPSKVLGLKIGQHDDVKPGDYIPKAHAQSAPELSFSGLSTETTYLIVGLDIDAPFPSFGVLGPILHWIQPEVRAVPDDQGKFNLTSDAPFVANYIGPAPPPGSSPHRYIFFLYEQPSGFDGAKYAPPNGQNLGNMQRIRYDLDAWGKEINLGPVLAFNYFKSN